MALACQTLAEKNLKNTVLTSFHARLSSSIVASYRGEFCGASRFDWSIGFFIQILRTPHTTLSNSKFFSMLLIWQEKLSYIRHFNCCAHTNGMATSLLKMLNFFKRF